MNTFTENGSTYNSIDILIGKTKFSVMAVNGKFNYINVRKLTSNPFLTAGKDFIDFDDAIANYKNTKMKVALINFENELKK